MRDRRARGEVAVLAASIVVAGCVAAACLGAPSGERRLRSRHAGHRRLRSRPVPPTSAACAWSAPTSSARRRTSPRSPPPPASKRTPREAASHDGRAHLPHDYFTRTDGGKVALAENLVPWWSLARRKTVKAIVSGGLDFMWAEGPTGGHARNIAGPVHAARVRHLRERRRGDGRTGVQVDRRVGPRRLSRSWQLACCRLTWRIDRRPTLVPCPRRSRHTRGCRPRAHVAQLVEARRRRRARLAVVPAVGAGRWCMAVAAMLAIALDPVVAGSNGTGLGRGLATTLLLGGGDAPRRRPRCARLELAHRTGRARRRSA